MQSTRNLIGKSIQIPSLSQVKSREVVYIVFDYFHFSGNGSEIFRQFSGGIVGERLREYPEAEQWRRFYLIIFFFLVGFPEKQTPRAERVKEGERTRASVSTLWPNAPNGVV